MQLSFLVNRINYKLGQYVFTEMYGVDDIVDEIGDALVDLGTYSTTWDWMFSKYNNVSGTVFLAQTDVKAATYVMPRQIWDVISMYAVENWVKTPMTYVKYAQFANWNAPGQSVYQYYWSGNTIYLSEAHDIEMEFIMSPVTYTAADYTNNTVMNVPDDFKWYLKDMVLANMMPIYLSDWQTLADKYFQKAEIRAQKLANKYGKKYANQWVAAKAVWKGNAQQTSARNAMVEEQIYP
jgi:hypothetical protein